MINPHFSIIIPTLNEAKYLPKLLADLAAQTFLEFEVIIVDGGSRDKTIALAKEHKSKLPLLKIINSPKAHVCYQRNLGAQQASSEILVFCDADNRLPPYFLQGLKYRFEQSQADLLSFYLKPDISNQKNEAIALAINTFLELQHSIKPSYLLESMFAVKKEVFQHVGGFDESIDYAEGKSLIKAITSQGYQSKIFKDPSYTFSFRRIRKYGLISIASRLAKMELAELLGPEYHSLQAKKYYPMTGGALFSKTRHSKNKFLKNIQKIIKDL